jgi:predicted RNase H-like HicB family nuclease
MNFKANFIKDGKWWVAWTEDVPGALTQGETHEEARENVIAAVTLMRAPVELSD